LPDHIVVIVGGAAGVFVKWVVVAGVVAFVVVVVVVEVTWNAPNAGAAAPIDDERFAKEVA
jgi:hypothetical protein